MFKKMLAGIAACFFLVNIYGCLALLAGAAGGAGTAVWLSGKLSQEVNVSFERTIQASKKALQSMRLDIDKETVSAGVAQIMSNYTDGRTIWIDVHRISEMASRIEVRVGMTGDKEAANLILKRIKRYLE